MVKSTENGITDASFNSYIAAFTFPLIAMVNT